MLSYSVDRREIKMLCSALHNRHIKPAACDGCGHLNKPLFTSLCCQLVRYCSEKCQKNAEATHKLVCEKRPMFSIGDGPLRQIEDCNEGDYLPVIKVVPHGGKPLPDFVQLASATQQRHTISFLDLMRAAKPADPDFILLRPFYISSKTGAEFYDDATDKRSLIFLSPLVNWEKKINDSSYPFCVTPVFEKRLDGAPARDAKME